MKYLYLRRLKVDKQEVFVNKLVMDKEVREDETMNMFIGYYEEMDHTDSYEKDLEDFINGRSDKVKTVISNIDDFGGYSFDYNYRVSLKQARTMTEEKRPFIVYKLGTKKEVENIDAIYHTALKMKIEDKSIQRLGFLMTDKKEKTIKLRKGNKKKFRGVIDEEFPIYKKRPFNTKKVGYIKLAESTPYKDIYVEVMEKQGYKWLLALFIIICSIGLFLKFGDTGDWQINWEKLTAFKTEEVIEQTEGQVKIGFNLSPTYRGSDGMIDLQIESEEVINITYKVKLFKADTKELLYESDKMMTGDGVSEIYVDKELGTGDVECYIEFDTYKNGMYIGTLSSYLTIKGVNN